METIDKVWFTEKRIFIETGSGVILSRPLEAFPRLLEATEQERESFKIGRLGDDLRWEIIDEDIHISSFYDTEEPNINNEVARLFSTFPQLNVSEIARTMGINKSLLSKYIYGITNPSPARLAKIRATLHTLGERLISETTND